MRRRATTATTGQGHRDRLPGALVTGAGPDGYAARVLDVVDSIAPGRVMSYGDVAEYLGDRGWQVNARARRELFADYGRPFPTDQELAAFRNIVSVIATRS